MFHTKFVGKIKTHSLCSVSFLSQIVPFFGKMWKNTVQSDHRMTIWRTHIGCWTNKLQIYTQNFCFSTATVVARTRLNVTLQYTACRLV